MCLSSMGRSLRFLLRAVFLCVFFDSCDHRGGRGLSFCFGVSFLQCRVCVCILLSILAVPKEYLSHSGIFYISSGSNLQVQVVRIFKI